MKKCTLHGAIELCKKNGGTLYRKDLWGTQEHKTYSWIPDELVAINGQADTKVISVEDVTSTWIYEPPQQSAFQKWSENNTFVTETKDAYCCQTTGRKEGWNAAIDAVLKTNPAIMCSQDVVSEVSEWTGSYKNEVKALKED